MAVIVATKNPNEFYYIFRDAAASGQIGPWERDAGGDFVFVTKNEAWRDRVRFRATSRPPGQVNFNILGRADEPMSVGLYAHCHGRLVASLIEHFQGQLTFVTVSAAPHQDDWLPLGLAE